MKWVPAAATTFSSIIVEPMSLAPNARATWPILAPCVTQLAWMLRTESRNRRDTASVRRYSQPLAAASGVPRTANSSSASSVLPGWKLQGMKARKPT